MTIKLVLLKSGEDVIADVSEMAVGEKQQVVGYFLNNPCIAKVFRRDSGDTEMKVSPYVPLSKDKNIPVPADWVVSIVEPIDQLTELYQKSIKKYGKSEDPGFEQPDFTESD
jgi:hypothetical protein